MKNAPVPPVVPLNEKERLRLERVERFLGDHPKVTTAAKMFDEQGEREARAAASTGSTNV